MWDSVPTSLSTRKKNISPKNIEDKNLVLAHVLDLYGGHVNEKGNLDSVDNRPLSWKLSKKGSSSFTKAQTQIVKPLGTRLTSKNLMKKDIEINKENTKNRRMQKNKRIDVIEPTANKVVEVDESDEDTNSMFDENSDNDLESLSNYHDESLDSIIERGIATSKARIRGKGVASSKKGKKWSHSK